ncbi:MAG: adenylate kinase [Candidatus Moranbacteria bacterium CG23_combo_of_CG06-09_8_20_14_all_35_22]|nr:MAG: adenylate kinase [Candidatus Moranbacteria bacterium CG23_combo_of_CG06-09_8_20_14_all_35_22]
MNLIILGPQGSGKGTQAEKLSQKFDLEHIDMGKFLREVALLDTPLGKEIHEIINIKKELVSDKILQEVIHLKIMGLPCEQGIVFDGVPRNINQLEYFETVLKEAGRKIDKTVLINLSEKESLERISKRRICEKCKKVFIFGKDIQSMEEKCNSCGGKIIQRIDDSEEGVKKRLKIFKEETMPIVEYYKKQEKLIEINGDQGIEEVFEDILYELRK